MDCFDFVWVVGCFDCVDALCCFACLLFCLALLACCFDLFCGFGWVLFVFFWFVVL